MRNLKTVLLVCVLLLSLFAAGCSKSASGSSGGLIISEVVTSNTNSLVDPVLGRPDWVELCNTSSDAIDLLGYSVAESISRKYTFPEVTIKPGEYIILYCCADSGTVLPDKLCTGFRLSKSGGNIILSSSGGGELQDLKVPALKPDISYGVTPGGSYAFFSSPTPGSANTSKCSDKIEDLESSADVALKINEVMPRSSLTSDPYGWAEIYNAGSSAVDLSGYYISEDPSDPAKARLPEKKLQAGAYGIIKFTGQTAEDQVPFKISGSETTLVLSNNFGIQIDKFTWDSGLIPGISAGRSENGATVYYTDPTPDAKNGMDSLSGITLKEGTGAVRINEVLLKNKYSKTDSDGDRSPWVELYNTGSSAASLSGFALSDDKDDLMKWSFPGVTINANSYLVVFLSGKNKTESNGDLSTGFKLGSEDTELCLTNLKQGVVQTVELPSERKDDVSYGLSSDGKWLFYSKPTPSAANESVGFAKISDIASDTSGLKINEVVSVNKAKSIEHDWVEIYNSSSKSVDLKEYYLSDSSGNLKKWPLGSDSLAAGGYYVAEGKQNGGEAVSVSLSGETLYLSDSSGTIIDSYDTGVLRPGYSSGLKPDGTMAIFSSPTKGKANGGDTVQGYCGDPVFSAPGGHQGSAVTLTITTATEGAVIYYTLDGSTPGSGSEKYTEPLKISSNKTVKAIAVKPGILDSGVTASTYLFDDTHKLPVICVSIDSHDLKTVSDSKRSNKNEREGYIEYYEADGTLGVRFPAGLRVAGAGTIYAQQRSFNIYLRGAYGQSSVVYPFFESYGTTSFKALSLRNMGGWQDNSRLKDVFISQMANGMNVDNAQSKFVVLYINGEYRGLYELKENQNEEYFASKYKIDPDKVVMVRDNKFSVDTSHGYVSVGDMENLLAFAKRNVNGDEDWKKYTSLTDSDHFMDYLIAETFFACSDWYNQKYVHTTDNTLKWRPVYYDFDLSFAGYAKNTFRLMTQQKIHRASGSYTDCSLYNAYFKNSEWKKAFVQRYAYVLNNILTTDKLLKYYDGLVDSIKDEMPGTINKWRVPSSISKWNGEVSSIRNIIENRRKFVIKELQNTFDLSDADISGLFPNG